jgi:hypothetical protein
MIEVSQVDIARAMSRQNILVVKCRRMSALKATLPVESNIERTSPRPEAADAYNLMVLVQQWQNGGTSARAANLTIRDVQAGTVREALAKLVSNARELIADCLARDHQIPWIDPAIEPEERESRFMVPIHL